MLRKQAQGCAFFVSQVCYDLDHVRNVLSDYAYACRDQGLQPRPTVLTLAPCGPTTTLEFMAWLGIEVPAWLRTEIPRSRDPLAVSRPVPHQRPHVDRLLPAARLAVRNQRGKPHQPQG